MLEGYSPIAQAFQATLFTWALTAAGSSMVFCLGRNFKRTFLDGSLGFASGVMTAASFWSLLLPALEIGDQINGDNKIMTLMPVIIGFLLGAFFVYITDVLLPENFLEKKINEKENFNDNDNYWRENSIEIDLKTDLRHRYNEQNDTKNHSRDNLNKMTLIDDDSKTRNKNKHITNFRKIILLVIAVTVHNIPEGLAVGVGFGAIGKAKTATFQNARNLAIGIGIQNFPEGLAVSLPLYASGISYWKSFMYGQLSGMVEPFAGLLGVLAVGFAQVILPYALSFAAGAMLYVVFENLMPEAASHGNSKLSTWCCMFGFCLMMSLDVGLA